jgi:hypothetical protein
MKRMRKCIDEIDQLAKDQALVKKLKKNKRFRPFCLCLPNNIKYKVQDYDFLVI